MLDKQGVRSRLRPYSRLATVQATLLSQRLNDDTNMSAMGMAIPARVMCMRGRHDSHPTGALSGYSDLFPGASQETRWRAKQTNR